MLSGFRHALAVARQMPLFRKLSRAQRHDKPLSALMLDVDRFKLINDTYGHHVGDLVLRKLSEVCIGTLREIDLLGRIGGKSSGRNRVCDEATC